MHVLLSIIEDNPLLVAILIAITLLSVAVIALAWSIIGYFRRRK